LDFDYEKRGHLIAFLTQKGLKDGKAESRILTEHGVETQVMNAADIQALDPDIENKAIGGVFYPQDAHLTPHKFVNGLASHIQQNGVDIQSAEVIGFESAGQRLRKVITTRGDIEAEQVVIATGSWSPLLGHELKINLPIQPAKGYSITFKRPETSPTVGVSLAESKVAVTPMGDTLRFAGTLELAGLDFSISKRRVQAILNAVPKYMPQLDPSNLEMLEIWRGLRPCSPDGLPFLGRSRFYKNMIVAAGHAMIGISLGPITGKLVTQITREETPSVDLSAMSPERFE
jgi:D-amino-acid dehydrogenase